LFAAGAFSVAVGPALAGDEEVLIGRTSGNRMIGLVEIPQPLVLDASVFPGINGYATGAYGFRGLGDRLPGEDFFGLSLDSDIRGG